MDKDTTVATTILQQLGGAAFLLITGSKHPVSDGNTLRLHLAGNKSGANRLWITLEGDDTYTMRFFYYREAHYRITGAADRTRVKELPEKLEEKKLLSGVYCDQLQDLFEDVTGLYTTIHRRD